MDGVRKIDSVLQHVYRTAEQHRLPSDTAITQQILLFGDSFFGYRFTARNFTAIWSAADQVLKVFDTDGQVLETFPLSEQKTELSVETILFTPLPRAA